MTDFELTLPHVLAVVDALAALNRSNALLTGAEARIRELEAQLAASRRPKCASRCPKCEGPADHPPGSSACKRVYVQRAASRVIR